MISPALREPVRSLREAISDLETQLSHVIDDGERQRIERALTTLRDELTRCGGQE